MQYSWLLEIARDFFGFDDERITSKNWEPLYDRAAEQMAAADWADQVLTKSRLEAVFLTNDFDDPLEGFDTKRYVPCLRTDDLVFHLAKPNVRQRLEKATGVSAGNPSAIRKAIGRLFEHFTKRGARACAISLPPDFIPRKVAEAEAESALPQFVFWTLAEYCAEFHLPFDLMIGVNRAVYEGGVYQGRDLFDSRVSLIQYRELFNAFPQVTFPISVLASVTNQELVSYSWIFPERRDARPLVVLQHADVHRARLAARLEAVPRDEADRLLQRHVQARIRAAEIRDVQADSRRSIGRAFRHRPRLDGRAGRRPRPPGAARQRRTGVLRKALSSERGGLIRALREPRRCPLCRCVVC